MFSALLILCGCATGSHTLTGKARPQINADAVKIYTAMPSDAEIIGLVNSSSGRMSYAVDKIKTEAGKLGANGVVITAQENIGMGGFMVSGNAVFVP